MKSSLIINLSQETVEKLNKENYTLCCFLACKSNNKSLFTPLVWSVTDDFLESVWIEWEFSLSAYLSTSEIVENEIIRFPQIASLKPIISKRYTAKVKSSAGSNYEIELQHRMLIEDFGKVSIDAINPSPTVLIQNDANREYSTGICIYDSTEDQYSGSCVFETNGNNIINVVPVNKAFLMFTSREMQKNTVVFKSENQGILVDLTTSVDNSRIVSYDINKGWSSYGQDWGKIYQSGADLRDLLCIRG